LIWKEASQQNILEIITVMMKKRQIQPTGIDQENGGVDYANADAKHRELVEELWLSQLN
jgi:hypothetical protein